MSSVVLGEECTVHGKKKGHSQGQVSPKESPGGQFGGHGWLWAVSSSSVSRDAVGGG